MICHVFLKHTPLEHSLDKIHSWIRFLLIYHSPALAQHLDRVIPGWEKPSKEISSAQVREIQIICTKRGMIFGVLLSRPHGLVLS